MCSSFVQQLVQGYLWDLQTPDVEFTSNEQSSWVDDINICLRSRPVRPNVVRLLVRVNVENDDRRTG